MIPGVACGYRTARSRDFSRVKSLGRAFADEVFRVYAAAHPAVTIRAMNVSPALEPVIRRACDNGNRAVIQTVLKALFLSPQSRRS